MNVKEYEGTGAGLAIVEQSQPGDWDVMVIDSIDVRRGVEQGLFEPLPEDQLPLADLYPQVRLDQFTMADGKRYGITEKFGYNTIGFNKDEVDVADMQTLASLSDPKYQGRLRHLRLLPAGDRHRRASCGKKTAALTAADLPAIKDVLLKWKANARLVGEVTASQTALATGVVDILVGGGEWVTAVLAAENPALDFSIPEEGGIVVAVARHVRRQREPGPGAEVHPVHHEPRGQARLATSSCYWGMPANRQAALSDAQKAVLRFDEQPEFLERAQLYPAPDQDLDKKMQDLWTASCRPKSPGPWPGAARAGAGSRRRWRPRAPCSTGRPGPTSARRCCGRRRSSSCHCW